MKNRKIAISQPRFERFRQNLARRRSLTLLSVPTVKNLKFPKSKMAEAAILKNRKSAISPEWFHRSSRNLVRWRILGLQMAPKVEISNFWKSKMADGRHHEKSKNRHISATVWAISTKFGTQKTIMDFCLHHFFWDTRFLFLVYFFVSVLCGTLSWPYHQLLSAREHMVVYRIVSYTVLFFSHLRSKGWPHHGRTFSIYLSSVILIDSSTGSPVHVLILSIQTMRRLPRLCAPGCVPCIIFLYRYVSSWCNHSMRASLLWQCVTVPSLLQLC